MPIIEGSIRRQPVVNGTAAPTNNTTGLGVARVGDLYVNTTTGIVYIVTATNLTSTITWVSVGSQV